MRIGIIIYALDRQLTGISRYSLELTRALSSLPDAPEIVLLTAGDAGPLKETGLEIIPLPATRLLPNLMTIGNVWTYLYSKRFGLDVIHDPNGVAPFALPVQATRRVVTVHDAIPWSYAGVSTQLDSLIYHHWLPRILPKVDLVLTVSETSKQEIIKYLGVKSTHIRTIYGGVHHQYQPASNQNISTVKTKYALPPNYLLFVGSTAKRKNLSVVFSAYAQLKHEIPHKLVVVGSQQRRFAPNLEALEHLELQDQVVFVDYVEEYDFPAVYSGAKTFLFPSFYEGFGLPVLEAMACGTPVICSNSSSLPEVGGDAVIQVNPTDSKALAHAIRAVTNDRQLHDQLRWKGLQRAQTFTWQRTAVETLAAYQSLVEGL